METLKKVKVEPVNKSEKKTSNKGLLQGIELLGNASQLFSGNPAIEEMISKAREMAVEQLNQNLREPH